MGLPNAGHPNFAHSSLDRLVRFSARRRKQRHLGKKVEKKKIFFYNLEFLRGRFVPRIRQKDAFQLHRIDRKLARQN